MTISLANKRSSTPSIEPSMDLFGFSKKLEGESIVSKPEPKREIKPKVETKVLSVPKSDSGNIDLFRFSKSLIAEQPKVKAELEVKSKSELKEKHKDSEPEIKKTALTVVKEEEKLGLEKVESAMQGYVTDLLPDYEDIVRKGKTVNFCVPPSIQSEWLRKVMNEVNKKANNIVKNEGKQDENEAKVVTNLYTLAEVLKRMPLCEGSDLEGMFKMVKENYPEAMDMTFDDMIKQITIQKTAAKVAKEEKLQDVVEKKIEKGIEKELKGKEFKNKEELDMAKQALEPKIREDVLSEQSANSFKQFLSKWHKDIYMSLHGYLYDGIKGQKDYLSSPCGLKISMGEDAIQKSEDILAFYGSAKDWEDFYFNGKNSVEQGSFATFHRMHESDWPGCFNSIFSGQKIWDEKILSDKIKKLSKALDLKRDDFVDPKDLREGFGYK